MWFGSYLLLSFVAVLLQMTVFPTWFGPFRPDLITVITIGVALHRGPKLGAGAGIIGGMITDLLTGYFLGMAALTNGLVGWIIGLLEPKFFKNNMIVPILTVVAGTLVQQVGYWLLMMAFGRTLPLGYILTQVMGPVVLCNGLVAWPIFLLIRQVEDFLAEVQ